MQESWVCVASNSLVARWFFTVSILFWWVIMELDRRTRCNWTQAASCAHQHNEWSRKISRCRYLNRPSVESLVKKSHIMAVDWLNYFIVVVVGLRKSQWEERPPLTGETVMIYNAGQSKSKPSPFCRPELLCGSTIQLLTAPNRITDRLIRTGCSNHCDYGG